MYKRKCYKKLLDWKTSSGGSSAVLVEGARRVGKTTLVKQFAKQEYDSFIYIDFSRAGKTTLDLFRNQREDVDVFLRMLQLNYGTRLIERKSAVIFDEVQRFPLAREYVKHLVEDGRFDYIETGSLVSIRKNVTDIVIPSEEDRIRLDPLDFEEYLWACGNEVMAEGIRASRESLVPLPDGIHATAMRLFNEYMLVGGMPQSVTAFVDDKDFRSCDVVKRRIIDLYLEDIEKFGGTDARRAKAVFQEIPGQLSAASKRFKFSSVERNSRYDEFAPALSWLEDAHMVNACRLCADPNVGYRLTEEASSMKCYMADTGLLVTHAFADGPDSDNVHRDIQFGRVSVNKGMIVENAVAQQLRAAGHSLFYHAWDEPPASGSKKPRPREIDFLVTQGFRDAAGKLRICPVEAKSTKAYSTVSLDDFQKKYPKRVGNEYVLHPKQLKTEGRRTYLPLYMAHLL